MKKILSIILVLAMMLPFASCVEKKENTTADNSIDASVESEESKSEASFEEVTYEPLMYKAEDGEGNALYLLGSIHVGDERVDMLSDKVMTAFNSSSYIAVECDVVTFANDDAKLVELTTKMLCPTGTTVKDYIGEELYEQCKKYLEDEKKYSGLFDYYGPYFWDSLLTETIAAKSELSPDFGVDQKFLVLAHDEGLEVREVESIDFQYNLLLGFPNELYKLTISESLENEEASIEELKAMYEMWLSGDEKLWNEYMNAEEDLDGYTAEEIALYEDYNKKLVTDRNNTMAKKAKEYLDGGGIGFFVVGAAHIVGETGVAKQLSDMGYTVTVVSGKAAE